MPYKLTIATMLLALSAQPDISMARTQAQLNGKPITIATSVTVLEKGDRVLMEKARRSLANIRQVPALPFTEAGDIPDARVLGYGDCKTLANTYRKILVDAGFVEDSLLLAFAETENGDPHAVLIIRAKSGGAQVNYVYDARFSHIETLDDSIRRGYVYTAIEAYPYGQFLNWDGVAYR